MWLIFLISRSNISQLDKIFSFYIYIFSCLYIEIMALTTETSHGKCDSLLLHSLSHFYIFSEFKIIINGLSYYIISKYVNTLCERLCTLRLHNNKTKKIIDWRRSMVWLYEVPFISVNDKFLPNQRNSVTHDLFYFKKLS